MSVVEEALARFGYAGVFLVVACESAGIPLPGELTLALAGAASATGRLSPVGVAVAGMLGAVVGDNVGYWVGRRLGPRVLAARLVRRVYGERRVRRAERLVDRYGAYAVFFGRFVAVLRVFAGPLAGVHRMPWLRFAVANALGAVVWASVVTTLGWLAGAHAGDVAPLLRGEGAVALGVIAAAIAVVLVVRRWRRRPGPPADGGPLASEP